MRRDGGLLKYFRWTGMCRSKQFKSLWKGTTSLHCPVAFWPRPCYMHFAGTEHTACISTPSNMRFSVMSRGGGVTHIFGRTGMCRSNGSLFYKKSLNMGPVFYQKFLKHGSTFLTEPKFLGFRKAKTPKIAKFLKNGPIFQEKSLKWVPFSAKITLKDG